MLAASRRQMPAWVGHGDVPGLRQSSTMSSHRICRTRLCDRHDMAVHALLHCDICMLDAAKDMLSYHRLSTVDFAFLRLDTFESVADSPLSPVTEHIFLRLQNSPGDFFGTAKKFRELSDIFIKILIANIYFQVARNARVPTPTQHAGKPSPIKLPASWLPCSHFVPFRFHQI